MDGFWRHIAACNNIAAPVNYEPFLIAGAQVGWIRRELLRALTFLPGIFHFDARGVSLASSLRSVVSRSDGLARAAARLAEQGLIPRLRRELYDVVAKEGGPVLATLDRGAVPAFGVRSFGVHVNGIVRRADGVHLWVGRRAADKALDPGKLDHIVAGGKPAGMTIEETLVKEAEEEAAIPPELAGTARRAGTVSYVMERPEGLRCDIVSVFDLDLPEGFAPRNTDGEVERFELWPLERVFAAVRDSDAFKFNVNLVLIDLFIREGLIGAHNEPRLAVLKASLQQFE